MNGGATYFSIILGDRSGFTDQLIQFNAFYKLGLSLNYQYLHVPFASKRSKATNLSPAYSVFEKIYKKLPLKLNRIFSNFNAELFFDIYKFLGFNQYFESENPNVSGKSLTTIKIVLSDELLSNNNIQSFQELKDYITDFVELKSNHENSAQNGQLITFRLRGKRHKLFSLINLNTPHLREFINLKKIYSDFGLKKTFEPSFESDKLKVLIHIRQGDTSIIKTPWKTWIPVDSRREDYLRQHNSIDELETRRNFQPSDYAAFFRALIASLGTQNYSALCFSDGYKLGLKILISNAESLALNRAQSKSLRKYQKRYEKESFQALYQLSNTHCIIGESSQKLCNLVSSVLSADIIITSMQQRMLPKLISLYCSDHSPVVIILYRDNVPDYSDIMPNHNERFVYVNLDNPDFGPIFDKLNPLVGLED